MPGMHLPKPEARPRPTCSLRQSGRTLAVRVETMAHSRETALRLGSVGSRVEDFFINSSCLLLSMLCYMAVRSQRIY